MNYKSGFVLFFFVVWDLLFFATYHMPLQSLFFAPLNGATHLRNIHFEGVCGFCPWTICQIFNAKGKQFILLLLLTLVLIVRQQLCIWPATAISSCLLQELPYHTWLLWIERSCSSSFWSYPRQSQSYDMRNMTFSKVNSTFHITGAGIALQACFLNLSTLRNYWLSHMESCSQC